MEEEKSAVLRCYEIIAEGMSGSGDILSCTITPTGISNTNPCCKADAMWKRAIPDLSSRRMTMGNSRSTCNLCGT